jgi:hypothetical protein
MILDQDHAKFDIRSWSSIIDRRSSNVWNCPAIIAQQELPSKNRKSGIANQDTVFTEYLNGP